MKWTIAFDSACDMRNFASIEAADLRLVPLTILLDNKEVIDDGTTSLEEFQNRLDRERGIKTGTACPSVGDWQKAMENGDNVIALALSGSVSQSYQSASIARDMILEEYPEKNIFVMNTLSGSGTMEMLVREAVRLIETGASFEEVVQGLNEYRSHSQIFFLLQNVDNLMSNGRLSALMGRAVKALKLTMLSTVSKEGTMEVIAKTRDFGKTMDKCIEECIARGCAAKKVIISHCLNLVDAERMKEKLLARFPGVEVEIKKTGLICGYYAEKGGLIVALQD